MIQCAIYQSERKIMQARNFTLHMMMNNSQCFQLTDHQQFSMDEIRVRFGLHHYARYFNVSATSLAKHVGPDSTYTYKDVLIEYFEILHAYLEGHFSKLEQPSADEIDAIKAKVGENITACSPGYFNRIQSIIAGIQLPKQFTDLLANYRKQLIERVCNDVDEVHAHNRFFRIANHYGFAIPYKADRDAHRGALTDTLIRNKINQQFNKEYTPNRIIEKLFLHIVNGFGYCGDKSKEDIGYTQGVYEEITNYFKDFFQDDTIGFDTVFLVDDDYKMTDINWLYISTRLITLMDDLGCFYDLNPSWSSTIGGYIPLFSWLTNTTPSHVIDSYNETILSEDVTLYFNPNDIANSRIAWKKDNDEEEITEAHGFIGARFNGTIPVLKKLNHDEISELIALVGERYINQKENLKAFYQSINHEQCEVISNTLFAKITQRIISLKSFLEYFPVLNDIHQQSLIEAICYDDNNYLSNLHNIESVIKILSADQINFLFSTMKNNSRNLVTMLDDADRNSKLFDQEILQSLAGTLRETIQLHADKDNLAKDFEKHVSSDDAQTAVAELFNDYLPRKKRFALKKRINYFHYEQAQNIVDNIADCDDADAVQKLIDAQFKEALSTCDGKFSVNRFLKSPFAKRIIYAGQLLSSEPTLTKNNFDSILSKRTFAGIRNYMKWNAHPRVNKKDIKTFRQTSATTMNNLDFKSLTDNPKVKRALFNLAFYSSKIKSGDKRLSLDSLIKTLSGKSTDDASTLIKTALKNDTLIKNTGLGFYKIFHSRPHKITNKEMGNRWARSTTEELLVQLDDALDSTDDKAVVIDL